MATRTRKAASRKGKAPPERRPVAGATTYHNYAGVLSGEGRARDAADTVREARSQLEAILEIDPNCAPAQGILRRMGRGPAEAAP